MANNTRVNELQEKLLQAMDIINAHALSGISFDRTIVCSIEDASGKQEGKYIVNDGSKIFTAFSTDTRLCNGDSVYVTIPEGNYENQKMIIGKKTDETDKPFVFTLPFETIFDMTDNIVEGKVQSEGLVANALNKYKEGAQYEYITLYDEPCSYYGFTRLGLKANFKTWLKSAVRGNYGLAIILTVHSPNTASSQQLEDQEYYYTFSNKDMYGNVYDFETYYEQQLVIPLEEIKGTITNIKINFYQEANFYDKFNNPLPCSEQGYLVDETGAYIKENGEYVIKEEDTILEPNIFVEDIYLCLGYDISIFTKDLVEIYTQQSNTYKHSNNTTNDGVAQNRKNIKVRWVHIDNGAPVDMVAAAEKETPTTPYEVRWYRYSVGAPAADAFCGVYWKRIEGATGFSYEFDPNIDLQQEKIKVIIVYNEATPYRSNELLFENEEDLPPSAEAQHIISALTITTDDGTNGNYMIYGQDNSIKDTEYGKISRSLSVWFDANNDGELSTNEEITHMDNNGASSENYLVWTFPAQNTMIDVVDPNKIEIKENEGTENEKIIAYQIYTCEPWYKIASYYTPNKSNNTVTCEYQLNGRVYTTEKEFTFGPAGTMGTDQTLVIDFVGDVNAVNLADEADNNIKIQVQLYNNQNINQQIPDGSVVWAWYYNSELSNVKFPYVLEGKVNSEIIFEKTDFDINGLYILQCSIGNLTTYFPIPVQSGGYSFIKGPTQVIYRSDGEPTYSREPYALYSNNKDVGITDWKILYKTSKQDELKFIGSISKQHKLQPLPIYVKDAPIYGIQAKNGATTLWTQPILVLQNQWPNGVVNAWDGESLVLDEEKSTILTAAISAGKKNSDDNTFSGVMLGNWKGQDVDGSITEQTGIYGFDHGAMSYAFKENGTAFLGKDGVGRININGDKATIYSPNYESGQGMMIDLNDPYLEMKYKTQNETHIIRIDASKSGGINSANDSKAPFKIGNNFAADWDGTIYAKNGNFEGTITGSVLKAPSSEVIYLDGVLTVANKNDKNEYVPQGYFGEMFSGLPGVKEEDIGGVGISASNATVSSLVKVTASNVGMKYDNHYLTITQSGVSIGKDNGDCAIRFQDNTIFLQGKYDENGYSGITIKAPNTVSGDDIDDDEPVIDCNIPASNQFGLYARFA